MLAIAYARWSSLEQTKGSTLARQIEATTGLIAAKGWASAGEPLIDRGKSAYTGDNIETGQLGQFAKSIISGELNPVGLALVVEELDRLSRQPADVMLSWLSPLVRRGLTIAVVNTGQMITRDMLDADMGGLMMILITAFGSFTESRKKSVRVAAAWEQKREDARNGKAIIQRNHRRPKWVEIDEAGEFYVQPIKRQIIETVFKNRIAGVGKGLTAQQLNELALTIPAYAPWELDAGTRKAPKMWSATYVGRILRNCAVMGEWQPFRRPRKGEAVALEPITDYYPRVIDPGTFAQANQERIKDALKHQGRGKNLSNLLGTRARCAECGGQMSALGSAAYFTNKKGEKRRHYFLYCTRAKVAKTCDNAMGWTYDRVEGPILDRILTLAMDDQHFAVTDDVSLKEAAVYTAKGMVSDLEAKIDNLLDALEVGGERAKDRLRQRQTELEAAKEALQAAQNALATIRGRVSPAEHIRRVSEVRALMWDDDEALKFQARSKVKAALADVIESIKFHPATGNVSVMIVDRMRMFTISHAGDIVSDLDLAALFPDDVGPGYGPVEHSRDGKVVRVLNDLSVGQKAGSAAYAKRRDAAV